MSRTLLLVGGAIALVLGAVWALQGTGVLPGSFMTGDRTWLVVGVVLVVVGAVLVALGVRRGPAGRP